MHEIDNPDRNAAAWPSVHRYGLFPVFEPGDSAPTYASLWDSVLVKGGVRALRSQRVRDALSKLPAAVADSLISSSLRISSFAGEAAPAVVAKTVFSSFSLEWIADRYRPTIVVVRRNPLNIVSSWRSLGWQAPAPGDRQVVWSAFEEQLEALEAPPPPPDSDIRRLAWWIAVQLRAQELMAARHPEWIVVTYDDLCLSPASAWPEVFSRLGVGSAQKGIDHLEARDLPGEGPLDTRRITREQQDAWRRRLSDQDVSAAVSVLETFPPGWWHDYIPGPGLDGHLKEVAK